MGTAMVPMESARVAVETQQSWGVGLTLPFLHPPIWVVLGKGRD